jgi:hypothetical protein
VHSLGRQARRALRSQRRADCFFRSGVGADDWDGSLRQQYAASPAKNARDPLHMIGALNAKGMDHTEPRPNFGMDVLVGVNADDDFDRVGLAHVEGSPEVRTRRCPASGQDCDGTGSLKLLLSHVSADRQAHLENHAMTRGQSQ